MGGKKLIGVRSTIILILIIANFAGQYYSANSCFPLHRFTLSENTLF